MREIKFRAWDLLNHCWLPVRGNYPHSVNATQKTHESELVEQGNVFRLNYRVEKEHGWGTEGNDAIICMYTGLKDRNGTEIYEGDIVKVSFPDDWCWEKGDKEKHHNAGKLMNICEVKFSPRQGFIIFPNDPWYEWEIIGNIYENPELLK